MDNVQPLISICVPTYMRASFIGKLIESTIKLDSFDNQVQLVIVDNCSTDQTHEIVKSYVDNYPQKNIKYVCNDRNIGVGNFYKALQSGDGIYCKLINDYIIIGDGFLHQLKEKVKKYRYCDKTQTALFFITSLRVKEKKISNEYLAQGVNEFVAQINNKMTWVSNAGMFRSQISECLQFEKYNYRILPTQYWALHLSSTRKKSIIVDCDFEGIIPVPNSKRLLRYNFFQPHVQWYYEIINSFTKLPSAVRQLDRERLLTDFVGIKIIEYLIEKKYCPFELKGSWGILIKEFWSTPYFYELLYKNYKRKYQNKYHVRTSIKKLIKRIF